MLWKRSQKVPPTHTHTPYMHRIHKHTHSLTPAARLCSGITSLQTSQGIGPQPHAWPAMNTHTYEHNETFVRKSTREHKRHRKHGTCEKWARNLIC